MTKVFAAIVVATFLHADRRFGGFKYFWSVSFVILSSIFVCWTWM